MLKQHSYLLHNSKDETEQLNLDEVSSEAFLDDASTDSGPEAADEPKQKESEQELSADSSDSPPDLNASGSGDVSAPVSEHDGESPSEKLKARIAQTEDPILRSKLLNIQSMHNEINMLTDPKELTKNYLAISPADLVEDNILDDDDEEIYHSNGTDDNGNV